MNRYLQVLENAARDCQAHDERAAVQTRAHFDAHPECMRKILAMDDDGNVKRGQSFIDVEARCRSGWFTKPMWTQDADDVRPLEARHSQTHGYWYRVDDLRHADTAESGGAPGTQEMGHLLREAFAIDKAVKAVEAQHRAEVLARRRVQREQRLAQRSYVPPRAGRSTKTQHQPFLAGL
jgi:hypothetical protein